MVTGENRQIVPTENVCVADEIKLLCIIRNMVDTHCQGQKYTLNLPASLTCAQFVTEVAKMTGYVEDSILVKYERTGAGGLFEEFCMDSGADTPIIEVCTGGGRRHDFTINEKDGILPQKLDSEPVAESSSTSSTWSGPLTESQTYSSSNAYSSDYSNSYASAFLKSDTGYVGLVNQAMTCYLNSLLQTLFMTPEFRNAIYRWEFDASDEEKVKSIPYQLQRLFLQLQTSKKKAVETTDVTRSFGWDSSEAWQQHDVQELCRVMFDALEQKWKNTDQADLINQLYQGKMKDYVKCLECGTESARIDAYLDIPLVIRPFGSIQAYGSVEEALNAFVQPETLDGTNQYFCEKCNKKCDAHKGLKFELFPYLLTLQLKRFDFDYSTMHRIKLNDRMTFPEILDLNSFVREDGMGEYLVNVGDSVTMEPLDPDEEIKAVYHGATESFPSPSLSGKCRGPNPPETGYSNGPVESGDEGIDEGIDVRNCASGTSSISDSSSLNSEAATNDRNAKESGPKGPYMYELFSIMIHSGNAAGGHYYAYIKSFRDGQWYGFNDQQVSRITYDDIRKTYGGSGGLKGCYSTAYARYKNTDDREMQLVFTPRPILADEYCRSLLAKKEDGACAGQVPIQIVKGKTTVSNTDYMQPESFPEHLTNEMQQLKDKEEAEKKQREIDRSTCKIKLFCYHPTHQGKVDTRLEVHKDKTLLEATEIAYKLFELDKILTLDCCRLVKYDDYHDSLERSFDQEEETAMGTVLGGVKSTYTFDLLLETKRPDQTFQEYKPGGVTVKVYVADLQEDMIHPPFSVRAYHTQTVAEFKQLVSQMTGLPVEHMKCVLERYHNDLRLLSTANKTLKSEGFFRSNKVYIECSVLEDPGMPYHETRFYRLLDRHQNTIQIMVNLPRLEDVEELNKNLKKSVLPNSNMQTNEECVIGLNSLKPSRLTTEDASMDIDEGIGDSEIDFKMKRLSMHTSSHSDPCVYHSCQTNGDALVHHSKVRTVSPVNFSTNSTSTSTSVDSAFTSTTATLVRRPSGSLSELGQGDNITRAPLGAHEYSDCEQTSLSEEPSELPCSESGTDSIGAMLACDSAQPSTSDSADTWNSSSYAHLIGSVEPATQQNPEHEDWDAEISAGSNSRTATVTTRQICTPMDLDDEEYRKYFRATPFISPETGDRGLTVYVDKRITLGALKSEFELYVGTPAENFKVYRVYSNNQEFESTRLSENLSFLDDGKLNIKLGRALKPGEYRVKVYQLLVNESEPSKYLVDTVFAKGMTVLMSKQLILAEVREQCKQDIPLNRCRLRKKTWKNPGTIYTDSQVYEDDIPIYANWEIFLEVIHSPEEMLFMSQLALYVKRWRPSKLELDPFQEIVLSQQTVQELKTKISDLSEIPLENIEFAKGRGTFPCEVSVLEIHTDLDWDPQVTTLNVWPLYISDDGSVVFYRDRTETLAEMSEDRKKEIQQKENIRLSRIGTRATYSPRKERALKIYMDDSPTNIKISPDFTDTSPPDLSGIPDI